jgi:hypothetical protein
MRPLSIAIAATLVFFASPTQAEPPRHYFQAPNGVWVFDRNGSGFLPLPGILYPGGLFFSKTKPDDVYASLRIAPGDLPT